MHDDSTGAEKQYFALRSGQRQLGVLAGPASDIILILTSSGSFMQLYQVIFLTTPSKNAGQQTCLVTGLLNFRV
jgi:hypothetical protein